MKAEYDSDSELKILREELGISRKEVANKLGVSVQTVQSWELGRREPDLKTVYELSKLYKTDMTKLTKMILK